MTTAPGMPTLLAGRYHLERVLGSGGMGVVYRARDLLHEQFGEPCSSVAIKLLGENLRLAPDAHVLLYSEFALTRSLQHERVVRMFTFEVDISSQIAFFSMELMHGMTLDRLLLECPDGLPWRELQPLAVQLLDAVAYVHRQGVLHGDVKPVNIMVGEEGIRLFDFGLGQATADAMTGLASVCRDRFNAWTPAYAAPELLAGGALTASADLYAVACVIYELAQGRRLGGRGATERLQRPRKLPAACWPALCLALAMDPERRTISVEALGEVMARGRWRWFR